MGGLISLLKYPLHISSPSSAGGGLFTSLFCSDVGSLL